MPETAQILPRILVKETSAPLLFKCNYFECTDVMAALYRFVIRHLDEVVKVRFKRRAARHGRNLKMFRMLSAAQPDPAR
jgi:hypothetical protein